MADFVEGGGPHPPYRESFLENIVNVSWKTRDKGGVWVSGDECCYERFAQLPTDQASGFTWLPLGSMDFTGGGSTVSGSYAKTSAGPVFLLGGHNANGIIMRSPDGFHKWQTVLTVGNSVTGIVWDKYENAFFATEDFSSCLRSNDGLRWVFSGDRFGDHCNNPLGMPDGIYGYDSYNDVVIYPNGGGATAIVNASYNDAEEFDVWTGLGTVFAVNFAGGIWHAGGSSGSGMFGPRSMTTTSWDGGHHWWISTAGNIGMNGDFEIVVIIGAPIKDIHGSLPVTATMGALPPISPPPATRGIDASQYRRSGHGIMASAISPARHPRPKLRRPHRPI